MDYKNSKGFTLIELIISMTVVSILAASGAFIIKYFVEEIIYVPRQLNAEMAAENILDVLIEGDCAAKGLRFSRAIISIADDQVTFVNQDNQIIVYRYDKNLNKVFRSINSGPEIQIPSNIPPEINLSLISNKLFLYYDATEILTAAAEDVRRISINLVAKTGNGLSADWEGISSHQTSIAVHRYQ